ncbi:MAG TPA: response regulator [Anaeromyxobacteraceae bacterium]|nr:response regulator [Anaeromyxobacteraceae bacterium]
MRPVEHALVFVRASGDRLLAAERLVGALPRLLGPALHDADVAFRRVSRHLVVLLRLAPAPPDERLLARLAFWTARAGGQARALASMSEADREALLAHLDRCELSVKGAPAAELFERIAPLFTGAGAPEGRRRSPADLPGLALDVAGPGWEGMSYRPAARALFVAAPLAPPPGDELSLTIRLPGTEKPVGVRAKVSEVRSPADAAPGRPAGFTLSLADPTPAVQAALERHTPAAPSGVQAAPRLPLNAPVKVLVPPPPAEDPPRPAYAVIEYATDQELEADFVENLSHGGAFVRSATPHPVGTSLALEFVLPNGTRLQAQAVVMTAGEGGMGVKFSLDAESDARLKAAIAHISARPRRALIVDDDALARRMLADALTERGFGVLTAADGTEGLRLLAEELLSLDLLVTDVLMPGLDGEHFVQAIRKAGGESDLAIVVVTGRLTEGLEPRLEAAGADAVLDKALGPDLIAQAADAVLERRRVAADAS